MSKFLELYSAKKPALSFEFFPPKEEGHLANVQAQILELSKSNPNFITITYGAGGGTRAFSQELIRFVKENISITVCPHLTCVGHSQEELKEIIQHYEQAGIKHMLALRGDPPKGREKFEAHPDGFRSARDFVRYVKENSTLSVAVAGYPESHKEASSKEGDLKYLKEKIDAGAEIIITQLFFEEDIYFKFVEDARSYGINVPIVPGVMPIGNIEQVKRFTGLCGASISPRILKRLDELSDDKEGVVQFGIEEGARLCEALIKGGVPGIHLYTLNKTVQIKPVVAALKPYL